MKKPQATATDFSDPYLHLEDIDASLEWVSEQSDRTLAEFDGGAFSAYRDDVAGILSATDKLDTGTKRGEWIYNFYTDGDHPRGLWRRARLEEYLSKEQAEIAWEVLLDIGALGEAEGESWVFGGASLLYPSYDRALITMSKGGSDANVVREFDVEAHAFVEGGFEKPESKGSMSWVDRDTVVIGADFGPGTLTDSGYPKSARLWRRGQDLASAPVIIEGAATDVLSGAYFDHTPGHERLVAFRYPDFRSTISFVADLEGVLAGGGGAVVGPEGEALRAGLPSALTQVNMPLSAEVGFVRDWLLATLRHDWELDGATFPAGAVVVMPASSITEPRAQDVQVLYSPSPTSSFLDLTVTRTGLVMTILDNVKTKLFFCAEGRAAAGVVEPWQIAEVTPKAAEFAAVGIAAVDRLESDEVWLTVAGFVTPTTLYMGEIGREELAVRKLRSAPARFEAAGLGIRQLWATSADGTEIPYFVVGPEEALRGGRPTRTLLDGYGGFEVSRLPSYLATYGKVWLERGGVYVVANIRGGGEFGPAWHQAALKERRHKAYEDFAAVAADLVERGITTVAQLAAIGGSNGGLLMGNMYTTYPHLFGAIVCRVPLLDMKRYSHLLAGASWMGEYGDPDTEDWAYMEQYSAYHNVGEEPHPPILLTTSTRDDRVHPGHARKFHALLSAMGHESWLYENTEGGHAGAADIEQVALMTALIFSFLDHKLAK
ncbi:Prolyl endopeptidase precursor [Trueperella bernardiae]|uniref:Prolyl endopeptidase n=1 Tax=Trueperella bernardiae TaxID=59561 RepID=A0A0W1KIZ8_9ACTO|nr:prolyl oligopeptidase family serine peptidase [Trueperella bernardiae]KTF03607.1 Prolyl endopeptidase precursor [Trueperella bernardiae]